MNYKTSQLLIIVAFIFVGCHSESPINKVSKVIDRVMNETIFNLQEVDQKQISGLNILDFSAELSNSGNNIYLAKTQIISDSSYKITFGSSSNVPFVIYINREEQFNQKLQRKFKFKEIAYGIYDFQDYFTLNINSGKSELLIVVRSDNEPKVFMKEILDTENELKLKYNKWWFGSYKSNNKAMKIEKNKIDQISWKEKKNILQHVIEVPTKRTYGREAHNEWTYSNGAAMLGMMNIYNYNGNIDYFNYVKKHSDFVLENYNLLKKEYYVNHSLRVADYRMFRKIMLDDAGAPVLPFILTYSKTNDKKYMPLINEMVKYVSKQQVRLSDGTFCRPEPVKMTVWADDMFMSVPMLLRIASIKNDKRLVDDAILQIINIHKYLWDQTVQLHKHAWFNKEKKKSEIFWSRANGWIFWAITDALQIIPVNNNRYDELMIIYKKIIKGIVKYQDSNGIWHQVLTNKKSFGETSGSAMFTMAIAAGVNNGWLDESYKDNALKGWEAISEKISDDGIVKDICRGTGIGYNEAFYMKRKRFLNDPRGLGALFTCATEVEKMMEKD